MKMHFPKILLAGCLIASPVSAIDDNGFIVLRNTKLAGPEANINHQGWMVFLAEEIKNNQDLNGDGDFDDMVVHTHHAKSNHTVNLGLAIPNNEVWFRAEGDWLAFSASEKRQQVDFNGDDDMNDWVLHLHNFKTESTLNSQFAIKDSRAMIVGDHVVFFAHERSQGRNDLNGDGDMGDYVIHSWNFKTGDVHNVGIDGFGSPMPRDMQSADSWVYFESNEARQRSDLNGDGDQSDRVLHGYNVHSKKLENFGYALFNSWATTIVSQQGVAFAVSERDQGQDLNQDSDTDDIVLHYQPHPTPRTMGNIPNMKRDVLLQHFGQAHDLFVFSFDENGEGQDLNSDGDTQDYVLHIFDSRRGVLFNLRLASYFYTAFQTERGLRHINDRMVAFQVSEHNQGRRDLNGDNDSNDMVIHLWDRKLNRVFNTGLAGRIQDIDEQRLLCLVNESMQSSNLNGDGDASDEVIHYIDLNNMTATNLMIAHGPPYTIRLNGNVISGTISESGQNQTDLNGDGDSIDNLLLLHHITRQKTWISPENGSTFMPTDQNSLRLSVDENGSRDLNFDGDFSDLVTFSLEFSSFSSQ